MECKIIRLLIMIGAFCVLGGYALTQPESLTWQAITIIVSAIVGALVTYLFESLDTHDQGFKTWFKSQIWYRKKDLYASRIATARVNGTLGVAATGTLNTSKTGTVVKKNTFYGD